MMMGAMVRDVVISKFELNVKFGRYPMLRRTTIRLNMGSVSLRARLFASLPDRPDGLRPGSAGNSLLLTLRST